MNKNYNEVILVDERDIQIGVYDKLKAHKEAKLHRAFSVFVFNSMGQLLLQKRAYNKYHTGGLWSNTCCSHPINGENVLEAAKRRLLEEINLKCDLSELFSFCYKVDLHELYEYEYDHVLIGYCDLEPIINEEEVCEYKWVDFNKILKDINESSSKYTYWFKHILNNYSELLYEKVKIRSVTISLKDIEKRIHSDLIDMFKLVKDNCTYDSKLSESLEYSLNVSGRFKRPLLLYISYLVMNNSSFNDLKYIAGSVELMHTASLIHDDIIDEGMKRRGKESVYCKFGGPTAIITGDYLIFCAQRLLTSVKRDYEAVLNIMDKLNDTYRYMCIGQSLEELMIGNLDINKEKYFDVIMNKTAKFFATVCEIGAIMAGGTIGEISALYEYGLNLGIAYQIKDDLTSLIDVSIDQDKSLESDMERKLITLPLIFAYQEISESDKNTLKFYYSLGNEVNYDIVRNIILGTSTIERINKMIEMYVSKAHKALETLKESPYKKYLEDFALYIL